MSKKHLILSQHQFDLLLHLPVHDLPVHHLPVHHLPIYHLPHHNNTSCSSEIKENRISAFRARGSTFRIKMASPQKLLNISECLSYSEASG